MTIAALRNNKPNDPNIAAPLTECINKYDAEKAENIPDIHAKIARSRRAFMVPLPFCITSVEECPHGDIEEEKAD